MNGEKLSIEFLESLSDSELSELSNKAYNKQINNESSGNGVYEQYIFDIQEEQKKICIRIQGVLKEQGFIYMRKILIENYGSNSNNA